MYIGQHDDLHVLEQMLDGYYIALHAHRIVEDVPQMTRHFIDWLRKRTRWSTSCGWAVAIHDRHPAREEQFDCFFRLVDEYRKLRLVVVGAVDLPAVEAPRGAPEAAASKALEERPRRIELVRYAPSRLHFLRYHHDDGIVDDKHLLSGQKCLLVDSREMAAERVRKEFEVEPSAWTWTRPGRQARAGAVAERG
jgi:hypothetical protein